MSGFKRYCAIAAIVFAPAAAAAAEHKDDSPPPGCTAWNTGLAPEWMPWAAEARAAQAAASPAGLTAASVTVARKFAVTLLPAKSVHMVVESPDIDPPKDAHGGMLALEVPADGYYWIAVDNGLWIDVVQAGVIQMSSAHGPGPHCADVGKTVQFMLKQGAATIQLSDNEGAKVVMMVVRQP